MPDVRHPLPTRLEAEEVLRDVVAELYVFPAVQAEPALLEGVFYRIGVFRHVSEDVLETAAGGLCGGERGGVEFSGEAPQELRK